MKDERCSLNELNIRICVHSRGGIREDLRMEPWRLYVISVEPQVFSQGRFSRERKEKKRIYMHLQQQEVSSSLCQQKEEVFSRLD